MEIDTTPTLMYLLKLQITVSDLRRSRIVGTRMTKSSILSGAYDARIGSRQKLVGAENRNTDLNLSVHWHALVKTTRLGFQPQIS